MAHGSKMLALTTWGRKSSLPRHTILSYLLVDGKEVVASGWGARSDWVKNILVNPDVTLQIGRKVYSAKARHIQDLNEYSQVAREMCASGGDTHFEAWLESFGIQNDPVDMVAKRERLCLVAFDRCDAKGPQPLSADLIWVWGLIPLVILLIKRVNLR
jgi:deazaflavin-dependent oxidoreductase (nitroreductase family)